MIELEMFEESIEDRIEKLRNIIKPVEYPDEMSGRISEAIANSNGVNDLIERLQWGIQVQLDQLEAHLIRQKIDILEHNNSTGM